MYKALASFDIIGVCHDLLATEGWLIDPADGKIKPSVEAVQFDAPWDYCNPNEAMGACRWYTHLFAKMGFVPKYCRECYKIVVRVPTVLQLIQMDELMRREFVLRGWPCKCGIEVREWVPASYGGYLYNRGLRQGRDRFPDVAALVAQHLTLSDAAREKLAEAGWFGNPNPSVVLKRACTEFEIKFGPSDKWGPEPYGKYPAAFPPWSDDLEAYLDQHVQISRNKKNPPTPQYLREHRISQWLKWAHGRGDITSRLFNDGQPIYPSKVVTYHDDLKPKEALDAQS